MWHILTAILICAADQLFKRYADANLEYAKNRSVLGGRILLTKYHNRGAMLNLLEEKKESLMVLSGAASGCALMLFLRSLKKGRPSVRLALALIIGGAASNMSDRIRKGYVVDYFRFSFLKRVIFNLADLSIFLGSVLLVFCQLGEDNKAGRGE